MIVLILDLPTAISTDTPFFPHPWFRQWESPWIILQWTLMQILQTTSLQVLCNSIVPFCSLMSGWLCQLSSLGFCSYCLEEGLDSFSLLLLVDFCCGSFCLLAFVLVCFFSDLPDFIFTIHLLELLSLLFSLLKSFSFLNGTFLILVTWFIFLSVILLSRNFS